MGWGGGGLTKCPLLLYNDLKGVCVCNKMSFVDVQWSQRGGGGAGVTKCPLLMYNIKGRNKMSFVDVQWSQGSVTKYPLLMDVVQWSQGSIKKNVLCCCCTMNSRECTKMSFVAVVQWIQGSVTKYPLLMDVVQWSQGSINKCPLLLLYNEFKGV